MTIEPRHLTLEELERGFPHICESPTDLGRVEWIVRRPRQDAREVLTSGSLDPHIGLIGDYWSAGGANPPDTQLNIMNARAISLIAGTKERWALAGDQLYLDLDLSGQNLPPGTRLAIGEAVIEVTAEPHTGCRKFQQRFGAAAIKFVNSAVGRQWNLRGINAKVIRGGEVQVGDSVRKLPACA